MTRLLVTNAHSGASQQKTQYVAWLGRTLGQWWRDAVAFVSEAAFVNLRPAGYVAKSSAGTKGQREVALVALRSWDEKEIIPLTRDLGTGVAHDRWAMRGQHGRIVDYSVHANAAIQDGAFAKDSPGALEWIMNGLPKLGARVRSDLEAGLHPRVSGDMNWRGTEPTPGSPAAFFDDLGMHYVNRELLWVAWDPKRWRLARWRPVRVLPPPPGSDHIALAVHLRRNRRK